MSTVSWRTWAVFAALFALALGLGIAAGGESTESSALSVENPAPPGAMVLFTWLRDNGADVQRQVEPWSDLAPAVKTIVITAPRLQTVSQAEVIALEAFVRSGGTLIYLVPRAGYSSPLNRWLGVTRGELPTLDDDPALKDPAGATVKVLRPQGLLAGVSALRLAADRFITVDDAVPVTQAGALWFKPMGDGEVWLASGPDLAENARLELLGNSTFWRNVAARGPVAFDEFHHHAAAAVPLTANLIATVLQFMLVAAFVVWARGTRLGPARPTLTTTHRSSLEYVHAMASLMATSKVDAEVIEQLRLGLKRTAFERLGLSMTLPQAQWVAEVARLTSMREVEAVFSSDDVRSVGQAAAAVEAALVSGAEAPRKA